MSTPNPSWGNDSSDRLGYDGAGRVITQRSNKVRPPNNANNCPENSGDSP
jgi:hypothetical protein